MLAVTQSYMPPAVLDVQVPATKYSTSGHAPVVPAHPYRLTIATRLSSPVLQEPV